MLESFFRYIFTLHPPSFSIEILRHEMNLWHGGPTLSWEGMSGVVEISTAYKLEKRFGYSLSCFSVLSKRWIPSKWNCIPSCNVLMGSMCAKMCHYCPCHMVFKQSWFYFYHDVHIIFPILCNLNDWHWQRIPTGISLLLWGAWLATCLISVSWPLVFLVFGTDASLKCFGFSTFLLSLEVF